MAEIGRRTTSIADLGPRSTAMSGVGRPKFEIAQELLENLRGVLFVDYTSLMGHDELGNHNIFTTVISTYTRW